MLLKSLIENLDVKQVLNNSNPNITGVKFNSKEVKKGDIFICLNGNKQGCNYLTEAINNGAVACVTEQPLNTLISQVVVKSTRNALSLISKTFYNDVCDKLKIIMVTGTNGKTTTSYILHHILTQSGIKCALIGTNGIFFDNKQLYYGLTTPDPNDLHYYFELLYKLGVTHVVMEVSAHAIALKKLDGIKAEQIIFTNLTNEHLDYFKTMDSYANTKLNFINENNTNLAIVNVDDEFGVQLLNKRVPVISYGLKNPADTFAININSSIKNLKFCANVMDEIININSNLIGLYNVYNILGAITSALCLGVPVSKIENGVKTLKDVPGRFNKYFLDCNNLVVVDFAHTPDGFLNVLREVKSFRNGKLITVFGCVGYSDKEKRSLMGEIASRYSNELIITTDNPNFTNFDEICCDILENVSVPYTKIFDRQNAIEFAFSKLTENTTILILGKGCETSNLINGVKVPYSDIETVEKSIEKFYCVKKGENCDNGVV